LTNQRVSATHNQVLGSADAVLQTDFERTLACLIVSSLQLEVAAEQIGPENPLFKDGLGLDSIDALELSLAISRVYRVDLRSDDEQNHRIFRSLRSLASHVESRQANAITTAAAGDAHSPGA
jgi:acyl carrier protein